MRRALTIAGSDSGGGAGIQGDLKTFAALGVHGMTAITAITAQNTLEVRKVYDLPPELVKTQIECVVEDIGIDAAKTGMLSNVAIMQIVAKTLKKYEFPVVVDPVMVAESGARLLHEHATETLVDCILPLARVITPNRYEAEVLTGISIRTRDDMKKAARSLYQMGANAVVIKGGHMKHFATDILLDGTHFFEFKGVKIEGCTHGTGCSFAAAITAELAKGQSLKEAVKTAKQFVTFAIRYGNHLGNGPCPVNPIAWLMKNAARWETCSALQIALGKLLKCDPQEFIPEVGMNIAFALPRPYANGVEDVAAVEGRIVRGAIEARAGPVAFGVSRHLARALLIISKYDATVRSIMNIRYDAGMIARAKKIFTVTAYNRMDEPPPIKEKEGGTMVWGIERAIQLAGKVPDFIYHTGDMGKEPMILILGKDPDDVLRKFRAIRTKTSS